MQQVLKRARARAAALAVIVCLGVGCAQTEAARVRRPTLGTPPPALELDAAQKRHAEAIAHYAAGVSLELNGEMDAALEQYQKSLVLDPKHSELAVRLAGIYMSRKDFPKAVEILETAAKANPTSPEPWYGLGIAYRASEQPQKAITALRQTLKLNPMHLEALRVLLMEIFLQQDALSEAGKLLEQAWRQQSTDSEYWMRLGDLHAIALRQKPLLARQVERVRIQQCYERALKLSPNDFDILVRLADVYADSGNFQAAADVYAKLVSSRPESSIIRERQVREKLALNYVQSGQKEKAAAVLEEIIRREPLRYEIYNYLAELYEDLNQVDRAISNYQQSLVINPNQPDSYVRITGLQLQLKRVDNALQTLTTWKEKFPADYRVPYYNGLIQTEKKQYADAVASFADAESLALEAPQEVKLSSQFYFSYGAACERAGDLEKATQLFRKSIELDPKNHAACNYLGYMWADKDVHLDEAYDLIKKAVAVEPDNGAYIDSLGWVLFKLGRYEEALTDLRRASELTKEPDAVIFEHLAEVLLKLGKNGEALIHLRRAHELDPTNKAITDKLEKLSGNRSAAH
jgi:tetratricopeptide (TPR) repeat protein